MTDIAPAPHPQRWRAVGVIALAVSLIIMDATVVTVILPVLIREIDLNAADAEWVNSIYSLVFAAILITMGRFGDVLGRRRMLFIGTAVFGVSSLLAALSNTGLLLIGARFLQGIGGAMVLPATLSTINALFTGRERGIAFAIWGSTIGGMAAIGPLAGGWLTTAFSWHWAFLVNIPLVAIVLLGTWAFVPETRDPEAQPVRDWLGVLLSVVGLAALVFGLIEGQRYGWWQSEASFAIGGWSWPLTLSPVPFAFALGVVALVGFVLHEQDWKRRNRPALVDLGLFELRSFRYGAIAALVVALGEFGVLFVFPLFVQGVLDYSAKDTGLLILALAIGTFLVSGATAPISRRIGPRGVVRLGLGLEVVAILGLSLSLSAAMSGFVIAAWLFIYGAGVGFATAQLTGVILAEVPPSQSGQASGLQSTVRQLGSSIGIALLGTLLVSNLGVQFSGLVSGLPGLDPATAASALQQVKDTAGAEISALSALPGGAALVDAGRAAMVGAARITTLIAAAVIFVGLLATFRLPASIDERAARH